MKFKTSINKENKTIKPSVKQAGVEVFLFIKKQRYLQEKICKEANEHVIAANLNSTSAVTKAISLNTNDLMVRPLVGRDSMDDWGGTDGGSKGKGV